MEKLIAKTTPEENPLRTKVLDVWAVIFNQSLDTSEESISAAHQQLVAGMLKRQVI